jgi:hypothetical protein
MPTRVLLRATLVSELVQANWRFHSEIVFFSAPGATVLWPLICHRRVCVAFLSLHVHANAIAGACGQRRRARNPISGNWEIYL